MLDSRTGSERTRQRLLEAAGQVFAEKGFRSATIREICARARANVAAVNYHFKDKHALYLAVLQDAHARALEKYPPTLGTRPGDTPEARLNAFIRAFLLRLLDDGRPAWQGRLMAREIAEPTAALDVIVQRSIRPHFMLLSSIVRELLGASASPARVLLSTRSVVAQCLFYFHSRSVIARLQPRERLGPAAVERLTAHISRFSLAALKAGASRP